VKHELAPELAPGNFEPILNSSLRLFREYVAAMTDGRLELEPRVHRLPDLCVSVGTEAKSPQVAGLLNETEIWRALPDSLKDSTDFWWTIYPSHVPEQYPDFAKTEFVTGGMSTGPDGLSPHFIIDDRWLFRRPPHLGHGTYADVERRAYLPQWLQHEFYHHVFKRYPQLRLEATPHQWLDRNTWPADFEGRYEADYYEEALHKRLVAAKPPVNAQLRYAPLPQREALSKMTFRDVLGEYRRAPVDNGYHLVTVESTSTGLVWRNAAGASWSLTPDLPGGTLETGPDCPYYKQANGKGVVIRLKADGNATPVPSVDSLQFLGETYVRLP